MLAQRREALPISWFTIHSKSVRELLSLSLGAKFRSISISRVCHLFDLNKRLLKRILT